MWTGVGLVEVGRRGRPAIAPRRSTPSPLAEGGEGRGEEGLPAYERTGLLAGLGPSPQPSPRSFLTGRGRRTSARAARLPLLPPYVFSVVWHAIDHNWGARRRQRQGQRAASRAQGGL